MRASELTGAALDWAVVKCECDMPSPFKSIPVVLNGTVRVFRGDMGLHSDPISPSTNWAHGGHIIDREDIAISPLPDGLWRAYAADGTMWAPHGVEVFNWKRKQQGYHPLIAAMRCYVASKLGDEVEIPTELTQGETK